MKRLATLTISSLIALTSLTGTAAFAAEDTVYPNDEDFIKSLTFSNLNDYAAGGGAYAFADGRTVLLYDNGNISDYSFESRVNALDYADGTFYCKTDGGSVYSLPYVHGDEKADYEMPEPENTLIAGEYVYTLTGTSLKIADFQSDTIHIADGEYSNLKKFGSAVYAMSGNVVYEFTGSERGELNLDYADYAATQIIKVGQAATMLKEYSAPVFVTVAEGAHMTEVNLESTDGENFDTGVTVSAGKDTVALLLCYTGNAAVISVGGDGYILLKSNVTETEAVRYSTPEYEYGRIITSDGIYSSPYMAGGTKITDGAGLTVKVLNKVDYIGVLLTSFYEIEFTAADGETRKGYVAQAHVIKTDYVKEDDKKPTEFPDPGHSEEGNTRTVLIIFAVVLLVLVAVGYLAFAATADKRKKEKKHKDAPKTENK